MQLKMDIDTEKSAIDVSNAIASLSKPIVSVDILRIPNKFAPLMYCNGARQMERCTGISHNSIINWVKETGGRLPETEAVETIAEVGEIDELQTFVGSKKTSSLYRQQ